MLSLNMLMRPALLQYLTFTLPFAAFYNDACRQVQPILNEIFHV